MSFTFLAILVAIALLFCGGILLPLSWVGSAHVSGWFWLGVVVVLMSWLIGD